MIRMQCRGITTKGLRCKIKTSSGEYCKHHLYQTNVGLGQSQHAGLIYVFTISHLLSTNPAKRNWLRVNSGRDYSALEVNEYDLFNPKRLILIKVGFTTQTIEKRLKQWCAQCKQNFTILLPETSNVVVSSRDKLISAFARLKISGGYHRYSREKLGFVCHKEITKVEAEIHRYLHSRYGRGNLYCQGCSSNVKIHTEWFMVPRRYMNNVFENIDKICNELG